MYSAAGRVGDAGDGSPIERPTSPTRGIRPLTLHSARHTWATLALRAGKSIRWIAEQLGHSDPAITLRIYAHVLPDEGEDLGFLDFESGCSTSNSMTTGKAASVTTIAQHREVAE